MSQSILAFTVNALNDDDTTTRYNTESPDAAKLDYEQARHDYDKWLETIIDYKAHESAFEVVERLARAARVQAFSEGFKAGIKLMTETIS